MGDHTGKQFVYPTQKQGRDAPPERKGMGIVSNEEECRTSETRQRCTPWEEGGTSWVRRSALWRCVNHTYRTILPGLCLPLADCLVSSFNLSGPWILLKRSAHFFSKMDPTTEVYGCMPTYYRVGPLPFSTPKNFLHMCRQGGLPWPQEWAPTCLLALAGLFLPLALSLEYRGENKGSILLHLTTPGVWPRGPLSPTSQIYPDVDCSGWEATPMTLSYALSLVSPFLLQPYGSHFLEASCNLIWDMHILLFSQRLWGKFNTGSVPSPSHQHTSLMFYASGQILGSFVEFWSLPR